MIKIAEYLRERYGAWGWLGQRAHDAEGINRALKLDFIISCDYGLDTPYLMDDGDIFSIEKKKGIRQCWSNEHLNASLSGSLGREIFERWNRSKGRVNLIAYRSVKRLERKSAMLSRRPRIFAVSEDLKKYFDNKIRFCRVLKGSPHPVIPWITGKIGEKSFSQLSRQLSVPFVIQLPYGSSGSGTFIIKNKKDHDDIVRLFGGATASMRKYIRGFSMNVNGIVLTGKDGPEVFSSFPSVQILGVPECSTRPAVFCGNDYAAGASIDKDILAQVDRNVKFVGNFMAGYGFRGIFGMDLVAGGGKVYPVEVNPRFQNSTSLYTVLEGIKKKGHDRLFLLHVAEFLQDKDARMKRYIKDFDLDGLKSPVKGSQVILHNKGGVSIVAGDLEPGIYRFSGGRMRFVRKAISLCDCRREEDLLVTSAVPRLGSLVEPGAPLCKLQSLGSAVESSERRRLNERTRKAVNGIYSMLNLEEVSLQESVSKA